MNNDTRETFLHEVAILKKTWWNLAVAGAGDFIHGQSRYRGLLVAATNRDVPSIEEILPALVRHLGIRVTTGLSVAQWHHWLTFRSSCHEKAQRRSLFYHFHPSFSWQVSLFMQAAVSHGGYCWYILHVAVESKLFCSSCHILNYTSFHKVDCRRRKRSFPSKWRPAWRQASHECLWIENSKLEFVSNQEIRSLLFMEKKVPNYMLGNM